MNSGKPAPDAVSKALDRYERESRPDSTAREDIAAAREQHAAMIEAVEGLLSHVNDKYQFCGDDPMPIASRTWRECVNALRAARAKVQQ